MAGAAARSGCDLYQRGSFWGLSKPVENNGKWFWVKGKRPWTTIYTQMYKVLKEVRKFEHAIFHIDFGLICLCHFVSGLRRLIRVVNVGMKYWWIFFLRMDRWTSLNDKPLMWKDFPFYFLSLLINILLSTHNVWRWICILFAKGYLLWKKTLIDPKTRELCNKQAKCRSLKREYPYIKD